MMNFTERVVRLPGMMTTMRFVPAMEKQHTVVFFHGLLGDSHSWEVFDPYASPQRYADCYYVDFHFDVRRATRVTLEEIVTETVSLMREGPGLGEQPLTLIGNSFGGHLALFVTSRGHVSPRNLALFSPGGIPEVVAHRGTLKSYRTVDRILEVSFERIFNDPSVANDPRIREKVRRYKERIDPVKRTLARNLLQLSKTVKRNMLTRADLRRVQARTLLVWGSRDMVTPPEVCKIMAENIPRSRIVWMDSGHAVHIECPKACSGLLKEFCLNESWPTDSPSFKLERKETGDETLPVDPQVLTF